MNVYAWPQYILSAKLKHLTNLLCQLLVKKSSVQCAKLCVVISGQHTYPDGRTPEREDPL